MPASSRRRWPRCSPTPSTSPSSGNGTAGGELRPALEASGFRVDHSEGSLYLWCTRGESGRASVDWLAERGILVAPRDFYGPASGDYVRVGLTGTDERIAAAVARLTNG